MLGIAKQSAIFITCMRQGGYVLSALGSFFCLLAELRKNYSAYFH